MACNFVVLPLCNGFCFVTLLQKYTYTHKKSIYFNCSLVSISLWNMFVMLLVLHSPSGSSELGISWDVEVPGSVC